MQGPYPTDPAASISPSWRRRGQRQLDRLAIAEENMSVAGDRVTRFACIPHDNLLKRCLLNP